MRQRLSTAATPTQVRTHVAGSGTPVDALLQLELNPSYATAHQWHAINLQVTGHPDAAIEELKKAIALDPTSLIIGTDLAEVYLNADRPVEAEAAARRVLELDPAFPLARKRLAWAFEAQHRCADAVAQIPEEKFGDDPERLMMLAGSYAGMGKSTDARRALDRLVRQAEENHAEFQVAEAYASIDDVDHMLQWLEKSFAEREGSLLMLNLNPQFAPVRSDPRFQAFAARVGLVPSGH